MCVSDLVVRVDVARLGAAGMLSDCANDPSIDHVIVVAVLAGSISVALSMTDAPAALVAFVTTDAGQSRSGGGANRKITPSPLLVTLPPGAYTVGPNKVVPTRLPVKPGARLSLICTSAPDGFWPSNPPVTVYRVS